MKISHVEFGKKLRTLESESFYGCRKLKKIIYFTLIFNVAGLIFGI